MRSAFVLNSFPTISETFILNQITGLIDLGHDVDIYARKRSNNEEVHGDVLEYSLLDRTKYISNVHQHRFPRLIYRLGLLATATLRATRRTVLAIAPSTASSRRLTPKTVLQVAPFLRNWWRTMSRDFWWAQEIAFL